jgi:hypothetical protein
MILPVGSYLPGIEFHFFFHIKQRRMVVMVQNERVDGKGIHVLLCLNKNIIFIPDTKMIQSFLPKENINPFSCNTFNLYHA